MVQDINYITLLYMPIITGTIAIQDMNKICFSKWSVGDLEELVKFLVLLEAGSASWGGTVDR